MGRPQPIPPKPPRRNSGFRFTEALLERIAREARERGLSSNRLVEMAVEDWLDGRVPPRVTRSRRKAP